MPQTLMLSRVCSPSIEAPKYVKYLLHTYTNSLILDEDISSSTTIMHTNAIDHTGKSYPAPPEIEYVLVTDPAAGAFTVQMPKGWHNQAYLYMPYGLNKPIATANSPYGKASMLLREPNFANFMESASLANPSVQWLVNINPAYKVAPYLS
jgi:hypothetical protein